MVCNDDIENYSHIAERAWRHFKYTKNGVILWLKTIVYFPFKLEFHFYHVPIGDLDQINFTHYQIEITHISTCLS